MPGLLQSPEGNFGSAKVIYALVAEFLGTMVGAMSQAGDTNSLHATLMRHLRTAFHFRWNYNSGRSAVKKQRRGKQLGTLVRQFCCLLVLKWLGQQFFQLT